MNYVITNIRLAEEQYLKLKAEAAKARKSLSAVIRDKLTTQDNHQTKKITKNLLNLVEKAEKKHWKGPADLASNHDDYFIK